VERLGVFFGVELERAGIKGSNLRCKEPIERYPRETNQLCTLRAPFKPWATEAGIKIGAPVFVDEAARRLSLDTVAKNMVSTCSERFDSTLGTRTSRFCRTYRIVIPGDRIAIYRFASLLARSQNLLLSSREVLVQAVTVGLIEPPYT